MNTLSVTSGFTKRSPRCGVGGSELRALVAALCLFAWAAPVGAEKIRVASSILTISDAVEVAAPQAGVLRGLSIREGVKLAAGDPIAEIDAREERLNVAVVREQLAVARQESENDIRVRLAEKENKVAEAELGRATSVNAELPNTVSAKEIDRLRLAMERTELEIEHAGFERDLLAAKLRRIKADLALAQHRVERMKIAAPIAGVVAEAPRRAGEWVDAGETVARLVRVDRLRAEGYVGVSDALEGLVGRPVTIEVRLPNGKVHAANGKVVFVSPEAEPVDAKVRFWAEVDNATLRLRPGLTASVVIHEAGASPIAKRAGSEGSDP